MPWVWYLANDMQFFIMSPPIIIAYCLNRKTGYFILLLLIVASMIVNGVLSIKYDVTVDWNSATFDANRWMYTKPWSRMGAYFVGAVFGLSYFEFMNKTKYVHFANTLSNKFYSHLKQSRITSLILAIIGIGLTAIYVFPLRSFYLDCTPADRSEQINPN